MPAEVLFDTSSAGAYIRQPKLDRVGAVLQCISVSQANDGKAHGWSHEDTVFIGRPRPGGSEGFRRSRFLGVECTGRKVDFAAHDC